MDLVIHGSLTLDRLAHNMLINPISKRVGTERRDFRMKKREFTEWLIVILIILFFAIPVCTMAITDSVTIWPKCSTSFLYNSLFK